MALFITVIINDLAKVFLFRTNEKFEITPSSWGTVFSIFLFVTSPLGHLFFLLFPGFVNSLGSLFSLAGLNFALALQICINFLDLFRLFITGFNTHLQRSLSYRTMLVQVDACLNAGFNFSPIGFID